MDIITSFATLGLAALIHASFQLSVSVFTLLRGHALGMKKSQGRTLHLTTSFITGVGIMTLLILSTMALIIQQLWGSDIPTLLWTITCGLLIGVGVSVWIFYYRKGQGTALWIPRSFAHYLSQRTKATKDGAEAFGLGMVSVIGELLFIIAPLLVAALAIISLPAEWQLLGIIGYTLLSLLSLGIVWVLVSSGHRMSALQEWREKNKLFLQFSAGGALIILGFFLYVCSVLTQIAGAPF